MAESVPFETVPTVNWQREDYSRVPYWLYHDESIYQSEQERVFKGPLWCYVGLEAEIPKPGDFRTAYIGETPIIFNRDMEGGVHVVVNRCGHRGALLRRETYGNTSRHICIYHRWCFALDGSLVGLPFQRGLRGQGGMEESFKKEAHGLRRLKVAIHRGIIFASFHDN